MAYHPKKQKKALHRCKAIIVMFILQCFYFKCTKIHYATGTATSRSYILSDYLCNL